MKDDSGHHWLEKISASLGLDSTCQDWGVENSDSERLQEFMLFFESHIPLHSWAFEELGELILQSANDKMESGEFSEIELGEFRQFLLKNHQKFPEVTQLWVGLSEDPDFPVAGILYSCVAC